MLIKLLMVGAVLLAIPFIVALFVKKEYTVEREIIINKPRAQVFDYVKYLKNQDHYSKWVRIDPHLKKAYRGTDGTVGFVYAWDGNKQAGKGEQEIKNITAGERVEVEVRFIKPFAGTATAPIVTEAVSAKSTKVRWGMRGENKYPLNFMNLFIGNMLGKDLETSLTTLKSVLEK